MPPISPTNISAGFIVKAAKKAVAIRISPIMIDLFTAPETVMKAGSAVLLSEMGKLLSCCALLAKESSVKKGFDELKNLLRLDIII